MLRLQGLVSSFSLPLLETQCLEETHSLKVPLAKAGIPSLPLSCFGACLPACLGRISMLRSSPHWALGARGMLMP